MKLDRSRATRVALMAASSLSVMALSAPAAAAGTSDYRITADNLSASAAIHDMVRSSLIAPTLRIVTNDGPFITPGTGVSNGAGGIIPGSDYANSADVLDTSGVIGVGQMIDIQLPFLGLCSGTLINPRAVITAAHCVYGAPKEYYGSNTGVGGGISASDKSGLIATKGIPLSFGFESTNRCIDTNGCVRGTGPYETWRDSGFQTNVEKHIYNANQVWYGRESQPVALGGGGEFGNNDIAIITLDTHVSNVPTWTMLFSPLTGSTHAEIIGYGGAGVGTTGIGDAAGIDYRRRAAENMIDGLFSSADWFHTSAVGGPGGYAGFDDEAHSLYWMDFDDPAYDPNNPEPAADSAFLEENADLGADEVNWNQNNLGGGALPHEGTTAGGDSGGPLIVDQTFHNEDGSFKPVVAGVLTGGWSANGGIGTYGENSVYPPLYLYWQEIVANNPYKYVSAKAGDGSWFDPSHWVQDMDPNYAIIGPDGELVNSLPDVPQQNADSSNGRWGTSCFFEQICEDVPGTPYPTGDGTYVYTPGGPGSTNFVPNNVEPVNNLNPNVYKKAQYFDVTLREAGTTTLGGNATIDKLTVEGSAVLNINSTGNLKVWAEYNQYSGWTNVDGKLTTGEAFMLDGILTGRGMIDPTSLTIIAGAVAPGASNIGTLSVKGDMVLSSASGLLIDVSHGAADQLKVSGDADAPGILALDGGSLLVSQASGAPVARAGDKFLIASASALEGDGFGSVGTISGVLTPQLSYTNKQVFLTLKAGSLASFIGGNNSTALAFANALDGLRANHYSDLSNLYGLVDWMNPAQLTATFSALSPTNMIGETQLLQDRQSRQLLGNVSDRLSLLGTGQAKGFSFSGATSAVSPNREGLSASAQLGLTEGGSAQVPLTGNLTGFVTMGGDNVRSSYGDSRMMDAGQHNRYFASGIEAPMGDAKVGTAIGYAEAQSYAGSDQATSKVTQAAAYASLPIGKSAYVGGVVAAERASTDSIRLTTDATSMFQASGAGHSSRYMATAEAGFRTGIGHGLSLNPRAQFGVSHYSLGGFRETGGETALSLNSLSVNRIESRIGAKLDGAAKVAGWTVRPNIQADYVRLLSGGNNGLSMSFAAAPDYSFVLPLTNGGSGWLEAKGGVEMTRGAFTLGLSGQATAGDAPLSDKRGAIDLTFRF